MAIDPRGVTPGPTEPLEPVRGGRADPRVVLWRDSAMILVVVVIALLAWQTFAPQTTGVPTPTDDTGSGFVGGTLPPGVTLGPGLTFGDIVPSNLPIDATPTPIVAITLGPSPSPSPSPSPTVKPSGSPKPTKTPAGTQAPTPTPAPPTDTPTPATASFTWNETLPCVVDFTSTSTNATGWAWTFDDGFTSSQENPTHAYLATGTYNVTLKVSPGGDSVTQAVAVAGPCP